MFFSAVETVHITPSTSSHDDFPKENVNMSSILAIAMEKRRALRNNKERNYRCELLQSKFITSLCKHMGESRSRRRGGKRQRSSSKLTENTHVNGETVYNGEPLVQTSSHELSSAPKKFKMDETRDEKCIDPFGLDIFFEQVRTGTFKESKQAKNES